MAQKNINWLRDFKLVYNASGSFLNCMNIVLQKEYTTITGRQFDILYLFIQKPDFLAYSLSEFSATIKGEIEVYKRNHWGQCLIGWQAKSLDYIIKPEDEIQTDEIEFQWIELNLPVFPQNPILVSNWSNRLGLRLNYKLIHTIESSVDLTFIVEGKQASKIPDRLGIIINQWNQQAAEDNSKQKGFIHNLLVKSIENETAIFTIDTGSSGYDGLKLILSELNNPVWGVKKVTVE